MNTQMITPNVDGTGTGSDMAFDPTPVSQALTVPSTAIGPANVPSGADAPMVFDTMPTQTAISVPVPGRQYADNQYLDINDNDNLATKALKGTNAIGAGIGSGLLETINGGANLLHLPHQTLIDRENELQEQNAGNPIRQIIFP
jgi:hypothetical protein